MTDPEAITARCRYCGGRIAYAFDNSVKRLTYWVHLDTERDGNPYPSTLCDPDSPAISERALPPRTTEPTPALLALVAERELRPHWSQTVESVAADGGIAYPVSADDEAVTTRRRQIPLLVLWYLPGVYRRDWVKLERMRLRDRHGLRRAIAGDAR